MKKTLTLANFQQAALDRVKNFQRCAFYHTMGLGKTFTGSEKLISFNKPCNLIVCQKSKVKDWIDHMTSYYDLPTYDLTSKNTLTAFCSSKDPRVGIINYELMIRRKELLNLQNIALLLDESSLIKNTSTKRTKFIFNLSINNLVLLSGTPIGGKYEELYSQCRLLGWNITKTKFWDNYINYTQYQPPGIGFALKIVTGYKNIDDLKAHLHKYGVDFIKSEDVLTLPEQNHNFARFDIPKLYKKFKKDKCVVIPTGETILAVNPLTNLLYLRKISGVFNDDKLCYVNDLLMSSEDRFIIFYNFNDELNKLRELAKSLDKPISVINGKEKDLKNYEAKDNAVVLVQYQSGALGLNLQKASHMIFFTPPLSSENFEQAKKRIHRIGQKNPCFYYYLITDGLEKKIYETLEKRNNYTLELFNNDFKF